MMHGPIHTKKTAALSTGSETWTIHKRAAHKGRSTNEIFKTATQTDNKGPSYEI